MHKPIALSLAAVLSVAALSACSKPATDAAAQAGADASAATANAADAAATSASNAAAPGGAVSPPAANGAVNPDANTGSTDTAAASTSFTEGEAKGHIENAGYTDVSHLAKTPDGLWTAKAKKGGKTVDVALDFKGAVTAQ
ncbi:hypothetical protein [Phenylobacterium aquaticum]|uniref:hypothetical protein n=1 Tax=Phenylobacterium aquaticum TaxID=1763816 RepID=UPI001F5D60E4|nr:hypothetical protein [Phenylobacterium aquaticum]MCI3135236.1 hypothetical protein [Phenylobacterium aquaticum]